MRAEPDATVRRALLYAVGEYPRAAMTPAEQDRVRGELRAAFTADSDPGVHSAAEWLMRRWGWEADLLTVPPTAEPPGSARSPTPSPT